MTFALASILGGINELNQVTNIKISDGYDIGFQRGTFSRRPQDGVTVVDALSLFSTRINQKPFHNWINERISRIQGKEHWKSFKFDPTDKEALLRLNAYKID